MKKYEDKWVKVGDLHIDLRNPRMPDSAFANEDEALQYLAQHGALEELVQSIASSGWIDYEPLILLKATNEVIEGNRRLAALRLIADPERADRMGIHVPPKLHEDATPEKVRAWIVDHRNDARDFIGFKHINGPFKWDSFAKAKYAADWLLDDNDLAAVARRLGDTHKTVERLVNGYRVLRQAERLGFERGRVPGRFAFSHLYTALTRPSYRDFLGLGDAVGLLPEDPVGKDHRANLTQLMVWLYGQDTQRSVVRSQNPDLKRLAAVLPNRTAVTMLAETLSLDAAHALVEDKALLFREAIVGLSSAANRAAGLIGNYEGGDEELEELVGTILRTVRALHASMRPSDRDD